jgi:hypothetical protein
VWDRHIAGGAEFSKDIERELAAATVVIVAWSERAIESRWVKDEAIAYVRAHSIENKTYVNILLVAIGAYDVGPPYAAVLWGKDYARYRRSPQFKGYIRGAGVHDSGRHTVSRRSASPSVKMISSASDVGAAASRDSNARNSDLVPFAGSARCHVSRAWRTPALRHCLRINVTFEAVIF